MRTRLFFIPGLRSVRRRPFLALVAIAIAVRLGSTSAADEPAAEVASVGPGALSLFDGKSLDGWEKTDLYGAGSVEVQDGALLLRRGEALSGMTGITTTRRDLPRINYELTYEAQRVDGRDFFAAATFPVGEAYVTLVNGGWGGNVTGISSINGADASENETGTYVKYENGTWYRFRVRITDRKIVCQVDDETVVDFVHEGNRLGTRLETRSSQPLGFATWESTGALRNISIRPLSPDEIREIDGEES